MGTVVFPEAQVKFFLTANPEERSKRRYLETIERGNDAGFEKIDSEMRRRDHRDESRQMSPLIKAPDAVIVDTTGLSPDEVVERMSGTDNQRKSLAILRCEASDRICIHQPSPDNKKT